MSKRLSIPRAEARHIEFKGRLSPSVHLKPERLQHLATQMKSRLVEGGGRAVYVIGVDDSGEPTGLTEIELDESVEILRLIAKDCDATIERVEKYDTGRGVIAKVILSSYLSLTRSHLVVAIAGHVNHGKSTLVACLMTGQPDDGKKWLFLDTLPHEIERGLSADIHFALMGFRDGKPIKMQSPLDKAERSRVAASAEKLISFVDTVGHEPWLRTTIRGLAGQEIDYGVLVVAADDGPTHITREHLGIMLALGLPVIVCITKVDKVQASRIAYTREQISQILRSVGKIPFQIRDGTDIEVLVDKLNVVVPIIETSAVTLQGYDHLYHLFSILPARPKSLEKPFLMYIDKIYNVGGVGSVVSGSITQGRVRAGSELLLGPDQRGNFVHVRARSIEMHYSRLAEAEAGYIVGVALRGVRHEELRRGMVLCESSLNPRAIRSFEAELLILTHPTRVASGYEPVIHCHTISQTVKLTLLDKPYLKSGELGRAILEFKYRPCFINVGDRFVLREGKVKGVGRVVRIAQYV